MGKKVIVVANLIAIQYFITSHYNVPNKWAWLVLTLAAYFVYLMSGTTQVLWARGVWFSENDVLHIGLIGWMIYLAWVVAPRVRDAE